MTTPNTPQPQRKSDGKGWLDFGPRNLSRDNENPDILVPPVTDHGTMPNMRYSFSDAHNRMEEGGWAREVTIRELPASDELAGVNMALAPGAYRELHWHKEAEWGLMLYGNAALQRLTRTVSLILMMSKKEIFGILNPALLILFRPWIRAVSFC